MPRWHQPDAQHQQIAAVHLVSGHVDIRARCHRRHRREVPGLRRRGARQVGAVRGAGERGGGRLVDPSIPRVAAGLTGTDPDAPVFSCRAFGPVPLPAQVPDVIWRAGLDLNPLDVARDDDVHWLECLLWPGETGRRERLAAAIETARRDPPRIHRGDLLTDLPALAGEAPPGATLLVYHSAVLSYVAAGQRGRVAETIRALNGSWLSNEGPDVLPGIAVPERHDEKFALVRDGTRAVALTDSHGTWIDWLP
jgi:hypothetical protein